MSDFTAKAVRDGLLGVHSSRRARAVSLTFVSFDPAAQRRVVDLQWAAGSGSTPHLIPWAAAATPDQSTVVVAAQESAGNDTVGSTFGSSHALVYHGPTSRLPASAPAAWPVAEVVDLPVAPTDGWDRRFAAVDPTGHVLLYANATGGRRFSLDDGRPLGRLPISAVAHASDDGRLVAGVDPGDGSVVVYDVASGRQLMAVPGQRSATAVCLSADDATVAVAHGHHLRTYAVADGRLASALDTPLQPLALPAGGGDRFVAFEPDDQGEGGNLVVADAADGHVAAVLVRAGGPFCPAACAPDGRSVAIITDRWDAHV